MYKASIKGFIALGKIVLFTRVQSLTLALSKVSFQCHLEVSIRDHTSTTAGHCLVEGWVTSITLLNNKKKPTISLQIVLSQLCFKLHNQLYTTSPAPSRDLTKLSVTDLHPLDGLLTAILLHQCHCTTTKPSSGHTRSVHTRTLLSNTYQRVQLITGHLVHLTEREEEDERNLTI